MAAPTKEEIILVEQFRQSTSEYPEVSTYSVMKCLAWLRARDHNVTKAKAMFRDHLIWREKMEIDTIESWKLPSHFPEEYHYEITGVDADDQPIIIVPFGEWDIRKAATTGEGNALVRHGIQAFEKCVGKMRESSKNSGKEVTQFISIVDAANFSMRQLTSIATVNVILQVAKLFENNYPETVFAIYVINASRFFFMLFSIVKPLLSGHTLRKVHIYTTPDKWKPIFLQNLPQSTLPPEYGGTRSGQRIYTGALPYYRDRSLTEKLSVNHITVEVGAGKTFELALTVNEIGSRIIWTFETERYDIAFSINFNRNEEVVSSRRCNSHLNEEDGSVVCQKLGDYFVIFDNTYSKVRGKMIHYMVDVLPPNDHYVQDIQN